MLTRDDYRDKTLIMVVTIRLRGRWYVFSDRPVSIPNAIASEDGYPATLVSAGGLAETSFADSTELLSQSITTGSVPLEVAFLGDNADGWQALAADDQDLGDSTAELAIVTRSDDGTVSDWTTRTTLAQGYVDSPTWGEAYEPVSFTLRTDPNEDRARFPPDTARIDETTWPRSGAVAGSGVDERVYGAIYPWVFGTPGFLAGDEGYSTFPGSPAYLVEYVVADGDNSVSPAILLIAGHETIAGQNGANVLIFNQTTGTTASVAAAHTTDLRGRRVTIASVSAGSMAVTVGDELWVSWRTTTTGVRQGGLPRADGLAPMREASQILRYLLQQSTIRWDPGALDTMERLVTGFALDFFVNDQKTPLAHALDDILPLLPISTRTTSAGLGFVVWRLDAEVRDATMVVSVDRGDAERASSLTRSSALEVAHDLRIDYALRPDTGRLLRYLRASPFTSTDAFTFTDALAVASYTRYQMADGSSREGAPMSSDLIIAQGTARAVLAWKMAFLAATRISVDYQLRQEGQALAPGDIILLTDSAIGLSDRLAHVVAVTRAPGDTVISLVILQDWIRDALTA